jgi:hypothetical protein
MAALVKNRTAQEHHQHDNTMAGSLE